MKFFIVAVLAGMLLIGCPPEQPPELDLTEEPTIAVEAIFKDDGTLVTALTQQFIDQSWATMLIRGAHEIEHLPFDSVLFNKYYLRILTYQDNSRDTVLAQTDWRTHQNNDTNIKWARDYPKTAPLDFGQIAIDIQASAVWDSLKQDEFETASEHTRWKWGEKEKKIFTVMRFDDMTTTMLDSINGDSVKWEIPVAFVRDSTKLNLYTFRQLNQRLDVSDKAKSKFLWLRSAILDSSNNNIDILDMTPWEVLAHPQLRKKIPRDWIKFPFFRKRARWIKRRLQ